MSPTTIDVMRAVDEARGAAEAVDARSDAWLALHPIKHRRLRKHLQQKHDALLKVRAAWREAGRPL